MQHHSPITQSYWERESFLFYDHIIIGAGIVGLNVALEIREHFPKSRILILERGLMTTGATSRNAGFACMGSVTELLDDLTHISEAEVLNIFENRKNGLELLRSRLSGYDIGYAENGSHELILDDYKDIADKIDQFNDLLMPLTGKPAFKLANEKIREFGFSENLCQNMVENLLEGEVNTGKLLRALTDKALRNGIEIKTGAVVSHFEEGNTQVDIYVNDTFRQHTWQFSCNQLIICTNAFTEQLLPEYEVKPGRGQVLITKPIHGLKFKGVFHFSEGYYYFREIDGRILFGGGRNMDFNAEATTDFGLNDSIQNDLEKRLMDLIIPGIEFEIDMRWTGIMAFGPNKFPVVKAIGKNVFGAFRMGGMGVALAAESARQVVKLMS